MYYYIVCSTYIQLIIRDKKIDTMCYFIISIKLNWPLWMDNWS